MGSLSPTALAASDSHGVRGGGKAGEQSSSLSSLPLKQPPLPPWADRGGVAAGSSSFGGLGGAGSGIGLRPAGAPGGRGGGTGGGTGTGVGVATGAAATSSNGSSPAGISSPFGGGMRGAAGAGYGGGRTAGNGDAAVPVPPTEAFRERGTSGAVGLRKRGGELERGGGG